MGIKESFKKVCLNLGAKNKATYAVMAIAVVKGIARPTFTMMDDKADPKTKKYAAIREGLTEVVAIPTYYACGESAAKVAGGLKLSPEKRALAEHNFMFLGVCLAALLVIPALTSLIIKPLMKKIEQKDKGENDIKKLDIKDFDDDDFDLDRVKRLNYQPNKQRIGYNKSEIYSNKVNGLKVGAL